MKIINIYVGWLRRKTYKDAFDTSIESFLWHSEGSILLTQAGRAGWCPLISAQMKMWHGLTAFCIEISVWFVECGLSTKRQHYLSLAWISAYAGPEFDHNSSSLIFHHPEKYSSICSIPLNCILNSCYAIKSYSTQFTSWNKTRLN